MKQRQSGKRSCSNTSERNRIKGRRRPKHIYQQLGPPASPQSPHRSAFCSPLPGGICLPPPVTPRSSWEPTTARLPDKIQGTQLRLYYR